VSTEESSKSGWHYSPWFGFMYGRFPVSLIVVVVLACVAYVLWSE
jgi:hypothetical protein